MNKKSILFLCFIAIIILYPLAIPGYIFSLDQVFHYTYTWPKFGANNYWLNIIGVGFTKLGIPSWILEKLTYICVFGVIGYFGYRLSYHLKHDISRIFAILFLFINPFFYARFVEGQVNVYISYAFFIMFFYFVIQFFEYKKYSYWLWIGLSSLLLCLTSIHNIFILSLILIIFGVSYSFGNYRDRAFWKYSSVLGISIIILNSFWIIPTIQREDLTNRIESFGENHRSAFVSPSGIYDNVYLNILSGKGYWGEGENRFIKSELLNEYYFFIFLIIFFFVLSGISSGYKDSQTRRISLTLVSLGILSYILSLGISHNNIFSSFNLYLFENIPFYEGFREPHKWMMVVIMIYTYFAASSIDRFYNILHTHPYLNSGKNSFVIFIIFLPLIYTPAMFLGAWGQLKPVQYPSEWKEVQNTLSGNLNQCLDEGTSPCYDTLVFPWHGYLSIQWTGKFIVPAGIFKYFGDNVLYGDTIEIRDIYTQSSRLESKVIEKYIGPSGVLRSDFTQGDIENFLKDLQDLGISQIVLVNESDFSSYQKILIQIESKGYIKNILSNNKASIYEISFQK